MTRRFGLHPVFAGRRPAWKVARRSGYGAGSNMLACRLDGDANGVGSWRAVGSSRLTEQVNAARGGTSSVRCHMMPVESRTM